MTGTEDVDRGCAPPGSVHDSGSASQAERACVLCGKNMYFAKEFQTHVCLNKEHGVLTYYAMDDCYFTSRKEVGLRFAKEGRKFHIIEPEVLQMIGVES